jgi:hypothetical protein
MVDGAVGVRQLVPERNNGRDVGNLRGENGPVLHGDTEGLADDFKLPFDGGAQESIRGVIFEALSSRKIRQQVTGDDDIQ